MKIVTGHCQYLGKRKEQQDSIRLSDLKGAKSDAINGILAVLADGMGGCAQGAEASQLATRIFTEAVMANITTQTPRAALDDALEMANDAVYRQSMEIDEVDNHGTTLVACIVMPDQLYWVSVGDSRLYHLRGETLTQLTEDQGYGNILTHYVGEEETSAINRNNKPFSLEKGDWLLLSSDGLHDYMEAESISAEMYGDPQQGAYRLIEKIMFINHPRQDNVSVVVMACQ